VGGYSETHKLGIEQTPDDKAPGKGHDVLFGTIRELAARAMQRGRTRKGALALVSQAFRFAHQILEDYETKEPLAEPIACKVGGYYCCCYEVVLTPAEALLLGNHVKQTWSEGALADLMKKIDRTLHLRDGRGVEEKANVLHDTPCIFLASGKCSVYDVRPFACRALQFIGRSQVQRSRDGEKTYSGKPSTLSPAVLPPGRLIFIAVSRFGLFDMKLEGKLEYGNTAAK